MKIVRGYTGPDGSPQNSYGAVSAKPTKFLRREVMAGGAAMVGASLIDTAAGIDSESSALARDGQDSSRWGWDDTPPEFAGDPIALVGTTTVRPNASRDVSGEVLRNPFTDRVLEIHELKFRAYSTKNFQTIAVGPGTVLNISMSLADASKDIYEISNKFVSVPAISVGQMFGAESPNVLYAQYNASAGASSVYSCPLPRPLLMFPGERIRATFQHNGQLTQDIDASITLSGRSLPIGARNDAVRAIPYMAGYNKPATFGVDTTVNIRSDPSDLFNSLDKNVRLSRIGGRLFGYFVASSTVQAASEDVEGMFTQSNNVAGPAGGGGSAFGLTVTLMARDGFPIIAPGTPFRGAFGMWDRVIQADCIMEPGDYYVADFDGTSSRSGSNTTYYVLVRPALALVGWREENR